MKRTLYSTMLVLATTAVGPSVLHAQQYTAEPTGAPLSSQKYGTQELLRLMTEGNDGKRPIVILDSVRADEKALTNFVIALYHQQVRLGPGGVRVLAGDSKEAVKYGAKAGDRVIVVSTAPAPAPSKP